MNLPPRGPGFSLSDTSPQPETMELQTEESLEWLPLFEEAARRTPSGQPPNRSGVLCGSSNQWCSYVPYHAIPWMSRGSLLRRPT